MDEAKKPTVVEDKKNRLIKGRHKNHRVVANILKEINELPEVERLDRLTQKYTELYEENRTCQSTLSVIEKQYGILQKERDQLQTEQSKLVLARSRMESLCRELQRQNKLIKDENIAKIREEEERRKEVAAKFQTTLNEVTNMMHENTEKNIKLRDDNLDMANKIETLCEQFEKRKEHQTAIEKQLELEKQLAQAQIEKLQLEVKAEQEVWAEERKALNEKYKKSEQKCEQLQQTIKLLQENLELYSGKYQELKSSVSKSNQVFDDCKSEMSKMTKQIVGLQKEVKLWKSRSQKNAQSVIELSTLKQAQDTKLEAANKKLEQMQKLCRQLQVDRSSYLKLLKNNGIEPISQPSLDEQLTVKQNSKQSLTTKQKQLQKLKGNLKILQNKLTDIQHQAAVETLENLPSSPEESQESENVEEEGIS